LARGHLPRAWLDWCAGLGPGAHSEANMAVDIQNLFNTQIPAALEKNAAAATEIGAKYQFIITGDGGGEWFIDLTASGPKASSGNPGGADCTLTMTTDDFQKLHENPDANGMQLFFAGKLKVAGNQMLAMKLKKLFQLS
jgi:putative sterol carrier protein